MTVGAKSWDLPYHVCLSDLLFGEELYDTRRAFLQLPPPPPNPFIKGKDAGVVTPAMAQRHVGTLEIKDGGADGADAVAQQPVVGAPEVPAAVEAGRGGCSRGSRPGSLATDRAAEPRARPDSSSASSDGCPPAPPPPRTTL